MLKMVDGTGNIGVDMICPLGISTPQPPNYDRVELEGVGMLVLPNSLDALLERLELSGKTEQVQTTGKQMLNEELLKSLSNYTSNGLDYYYYRISGLEVGKKIHHFSRRRENREERIVRNFCESRIYK